MKRAHLHATLVLLGVVCVWLATVSTVSAGKLDRPLVAPPIAGITPTSAQAGGGSFQLGITTTGAYDPATIQAFWNGAPLMIVATGTNTLTVFVTNTLIASAQIATISITDSTGPTAMPQQFTVTNPAPSIANTAPSSPQAGALTSIVINGNNFNASTTAQLGANALTIASWSSTALTANVNASLYTVAGIYPLTVTNPTPGGGSAFANITVNPGPAQSLQIARSSASVTAGATAYFTATVTDAFSNQVVDATNVSWAVISGSGTPVQMSGRTATFTSNAAGLRTLRAIYGATTVSNTTTLDVTPGPAASVVISPTTATLTAGNTLVYTSTVRDAFQNIITSGTVSWSATGLPSPGSMTPINSRDATYSGSVAGTRTIQATYAGNGSGSASTTLTVVPASPATISVAPNPASGTVGGSVTLSADVRDAFNNQITNQAVNWSTANGAGTVNPANGASTTLNLTTTAGTYNNSVTASLSGATNGTATVVANPGLPASVSVTPDPITSLPNATTALTAVVRDSFNNIVPTAAVNWQVLNASAGTFISTGALNATFRATTVAGAYANAVRATATTGSGSDTLNVTVNPGPAANVLISPTVASMQVFTTRTFTATAVDAFNNPVAATLTWSALAGSASPTTGSSTTYRAGTTTGVFNDVLRVTNGTFTGTADITFTPGPVTQLTLAPPSASLVVSTTQSFVATARDQYNNIVPTAVVTWSVSPPTAGSFISTGALNATFRAGTSANVFAGAVRATTNGITATATITVTPGAPAQVTLNPNNITLTPLGTQLFVAQLRDAYSNPISGASYTWSTFGTGSVTPTSPGAATATFQAGSVAGTYIGAVRATASGFTGQANVVINPSAPASIAVSPGSATLGPRGTQAFTARAFDAFGNEITPIAVNWTVNSPTAGSIASTGLAAATFEAGTLAGSYPAAVRASTSGVTGTANITINPGPLAHIRVEPALATLGINQTQGFNATGYDVYDNLVPSSFTWSVVPPVAGTFDSSSATSTVFRAGATPNSYPDAVRAQSGAVIGAADIVIQTGTASSVQVSPSSTTAPIGSLQLFTADVVDQFGNPVSGPGVLWQAAIGVIESSGPYTALVRIGVTAGNFGTGVKAFFGPIEGSSAVTVPPDPASDLHISANPSAITTDGVSASTISVQVTDGYGNPVGAGMPVSLAIDQCVGTCSLATTAANTDPNGRIATTLRSERRSATATVTSLIKVSASMNGASGPVSKSVDVNGSFTPFRAIAPVIVRDYPPNNHSSCTALRITPPQTVKQPPNATFNIYRFTATKPTYTVIVNTFVTAGQIEVYRIVADNCAVNNSISVALARQAIPITSATQFQTTLANVFAPGSSYLLVLRVTGPISNTPYAITVQP